MATTKNEYDRLLVEAAHRVLLEVARLLYDYREGIVIVGGSIPGLILYQNSPEDIGTIDVDIALDQNTIQEVGYRSITEICGIGKLNGGVNTKIWLCYKTREILGVNAYLHSG